MERLFLDGSWKQFSCGFSQCNFMVLCGTLCDGKEVTQSARRTHREPQRLSKILFPVILVGIIFFSFTSAMFANQAEELMKRGNEFYQQKQYEKAIDTYEDLVNLGYEGTSLYYNLGNAYYREGKIGYSILYYEKALRLSPGDNDVQHNLLIANSRTVDKIDTMPKFFLFQWWENLLALLSVNGWTYTAYFFYIILLLAIGLYFFARKSKIQRYSFFGGLASLMLMIITLTLLIINLNRELNVKKAIVVVPTATVKLAPDPTSNDAFIIHEGLKVREEDQVDNWIKIRLLDGKEGWLQKNNMATI